MHTSLPALLVDIQTPHSVEAVLLVEIHRICHWVEEICRKHPAWAVQGVHRGLHVAEKVDILRKDPLLVVVDIWNLNILWEVPFDPTQEGSHREGRAQSFLGADLKKE